MPRLFTGFALPEPLCQSLAMLRGGLSGARWVDPDDYHVTLRFIGDVGDSTADEVHSALERIHRPPLVLKLAGLDAFGGSRPRAIVAGVRATAALLDMQAEQERLLRRIGLPAETRKYTPHITLARLRQTSAMAVADFLSQRGYLATRDVTVDHFTLFSARDSVGGGPYVAEAVYPLR